MPYIKQEDREKLEIMNYPLNEGELNYTISKFCKHYLDVFGVSYKNINTLIGALECAKLELYRRIAVNYEEEKIKQNGDVY